MANTMRIWLWPTAEVDLDKVTTIVVPGRLSPEKELILRQAMARNINIEAHTPEAAEYLALFDVAVAA